MKIPIAIVDDSSQNRLFLADQMKQSDDIIVCFTSKNGIDFLEKLKATPPNLHPAIVLMDIEMPEMNGIETVKYTRQLYPDLKFLMLTVFDDDDKIFEAIKNGASGYLLKDEKTSTIIDHIQQLMEIGGAPMSPSIARKALSLLSRSSMIEISGTFIQHKNDLSEWLSDRECNVLKLVVEGKDYRAIAEKLFLSTHTIRKHIANIYKKLHVSSKAQVINLALQRKWFNR
ncbi:MAG: response regulator transcription factor [Ferruginibacter sp.]|nr:response regulator transcription factor [Ferruginibacter sp.]